MVSSSVSDNHPSPYVRTFSLHKVTENYHFLAPHLNLKNFLCQGVKQEIFLLNYAKF